MKVLIAADIHYALKQFDWLLSVAGDFDAMLLAGDLLEISHSVERRAQIVVVRAYLEDLARRTRLIVCSGNHDLDARDAAGEHAARWMRRLGDIGVLADGDSVLLGDTLFTACPWWDGPVQREAIAEQLAAAAELRKGAWIWVHHAPPAESPVSWNGSRHYGDQELLRWIGEFAPDMVVSGHVHSSPFVSDGSWADRIDDTWVFNTGQQIGPAPAHIILNIDEGEALWFSLDGREQLDLGGPLTRPIPPLTDLPDWLRA